MKLKYLYSIIILCLTAAAYTGCSCAETNETEDRETDTFFEGADYIDTRLKAEKEYNFFFVNGAVENPYFIELCRGIADADDYYLVHTEVIGSDAMDEEETFEAFKQAVAAGADGILSQMLPGDKYGEYINQVIDQGVAVVFVDSDGKAFQEDEEYKDSDLTCLGIDYYEAGWEIGKLLAEEMEGHANVGILSGNTGAFHLCSRIEGFTDAIKEYPEMKILTTGYSYGSLETGMMQVENMMQEHDLDAIFCVTATDIISAARIMEEREDTAVLAGFDDLDATLRYISEGKVLATVAQNQYEAGWLGVEELIRTLQEKPEGNRVLDTGFTLITQDNVEKFIHKWTGI